MPSWSTMTFLRYYKMGVEGILKKLVLYDICLLVLLWWFCRLFSHSKEFQISQGPGGRPGFGRGAGSYGGGAAASSNLPWKIWSHEQFNLFSVEWVSNLIEEFVSFFFLLSFSLWESYKFKFSLCKLKSTESLELLCKYKFCSSLWTANYYTFPVSKNEILLFWGLIVLGMRKHTS